MSDRKNANVLMSNIFRHDIAQILRGGFKLISHEGIIENLIKVVHKFFKLLSIYSDGKVLTMTTNKLLKRKKRMQYSDDEGEALLENEGESEKEDDEKPQYREEEGQFQEKKYN